MSEDQVGMMAATILGGIAGNTSTQHLSESTAKKAVQLARMVVAEVEHTKPLVKYTVTPTAGPGGSIVPSDSVVVDENLTTTFTITPDAGNVATVNSSVGGVLNGNYLTTDPITADGTVDVTFAAPEGGATMGTVVHKGSHKKKQ